MRPDAQARGIGRALLDRAPAYRDGGRRGGIILSSEDRARCAAPRAGFVFEPAVAGHGRVTRPQEAPARVRRGRAGDGGDVDAIGREVRGAGHAVDPPAPSEAGFALHVVPRPGFVLHACGQVGLLAARDDDVAADLVRVVPAESPRRRSAGSPPGRRCRSCSKRA